jgi:phage terminase large subunit GpA-like protein
MAESATLEWSAKERTAWAVPKKLTVSQWAAERRVLGKKESAEPGRWRNERTRYLVEIMDTMGQLGVELVVIKKPAQVGVSEAVRNFLGWSIEQAPAPALWVLPDQQATEEAVQERLEPMITTSLPEFMTGCSYDIKNSKLSLTSMDIYMGWAGSPSRLATRPVCYVIFDEVNKYVLWSAKDADPIALGKARTRTWGKRRKVIILSTPTVESGQVTKAYESCEDQRVYHLPCVECGHEFAPQWSNVKWHDKRQGEGRKEHAARIRSEGLAYLECPECKRLMDESERLRALDRGRWISKKPIENPESVGFEFNVLGTPWTPMGNLVAKFLMIDDPQDLMEFVNQDLGEEWFERVDVIEEQPLRERAQIGHKRGLVPAWAGCLVAGVDTQKGYFCWVVRAFGHGFRSRLIDHGQSTTFDELKAQLLDRQFSVEESTVVMGCGIIAIDSGGGKAAASKVDGSRTDEVYRWSLTDPRIAAVKGHGGKAPPTQPIRSSNTNYTPPAGNAYSVILRILDTKHFKDTLSSRIQHENMTLWEVHGDIDADYLKQMTSEHKVLDRRKGSYSWQPKTKHQANHYWDAETYACAAAVMLGVAGIAEEKDLISERAKAEEAQKRIAASDAGRASPMDRPRPGQHRPSGDKDSWLGGSSLRGGGGKWI